MTALANTEADLGTARNKQGFRSLVAQNLWFIPLLLLLIYLLSTAPEPYRANWGDPYSNANAMTSGLYFYRYGFLRLKLTPVIDIFPLERPITYMRRAWHHVLYGEIDEQALGRPLYYTHFPALPDYMNGLERRLLGFTTISEFRVISIVFFFIGVLLFHSVANLLFGRRVAVISTLLLAFNPISIQYADSLHHQPFYFAFTMLSIFGYLKFVLRGSTKFLIFAGIGYFLAFLASYDTYFFLVLFPLVYLVVHRHEKALFNQKSVVGAIIVCLAGISAFLMHLATNSLALGFDGMIKDLMFQFRERATSDVSGVDYWGAFPWILAGRTIRFFGYASVPVILYLVLVPVRQLLVRVRALRGVRPTTEEWHIFLFFPGTAMLFLVFSQLFVEQEHTMFLSVPFFAACNGYYIVRTATWALREYGVNRLGHFAMGIGMAVLLVLGIILSFVIEMQGKTLYSNDDLNAVAAYLRDHDSNDFVASNNPIDAVHRYYLNKQTWFVIHGDRESLPAGYEYILERNEVQSFHFVYYKDVENYVYPKSLSTILSPASFAAWLALPRLYENDIKAYIRGLNRSVKQSLDACGVRVMSTASIDVFAISQDTIAYCKVNGDVQVVPPAVVYYGTGFYYREVLSTKEEFRWIGRKAYLVVDLPGDVAVPATLSFKAWSFATPRRLRVSIVGSSTAAWEGTIPTGRLSGDVQIRITLKPGRNLIRFDSLDPAQVIDPVNPNGDKRVVSVALVAIRLSTRP